MIGLLLAALVAVSDPVGDASGDGSLTPPSSPLLADSAAFDLHEVTVLDENNLVLTVTLGSLANPAELANGFSHPIIEIYVDSSQGGATELLPGSGLTLPEGAGWETALRITGDEASGFRSNATGETQASVRFPVEVSVNGRSMIVSTPFARPEEVALYVLVGVYDPFSSSGWRAVSQTPSPWAFSSDQQAVPVVDLLASTVEAQRQALESGVLPTLAPPPQRVTPWLLLMGLGVAVALVGVAMRGRLGMAGGDGRDVAMAGGEGGDVALPGEPAALPNTGLEATPSTMAGASRESLEATEFGLSFAEEPAEESWLVEELEVPDLSERWPFVTGREEDRPGG